MAILQLIPAGDLALVDGSYVVASGPEYIRQSIAARFKFFLGEWFRDLREGVPYYRDVFKKNPDRDVVRAIFRRIVAETPGVLEITRFDIAFNTADRFLAFNFEARVTDGVVTVSTDDDEFILSY
jgi:hypothetical protein